LDESNGDLRTRRCTPVSTQEAIGVFALDLDGGGLDAGHFAVGLFHDLGLEALALAVAQVLAQQHGGPVLGFGTAGAGLDVDEAVVGVHGAVEHAAEFHVFDQLLQGLGIGFDGDDGVFVLFLAGHLEQVARIRQLAVDLDEGMDDRFQRFLFLAEVLGPLRSFQTLGSSSSALTCSSFSDFTKSKIPPKLGGTGGQVVEQGLEN
jgi:hypothetical protein